MSLGQYLRFLAVGGLTALATVLAREIFAWLLGADTTVRYATSVVLAYTLGIAMSYALNRRVTFAARDGGPARLLRFIAVALFGMAATSLIAIGLRYGLATTTALGSFAGSIAFAAAALLSSLLTYPLNARLVFRPAPAPHTG